MSSTVQHQALGQGDKLPCPVLSLIPNSTQIPNVILDHFMPRLGGEDFKVLVFLFRKTLGWRKRRDRLSLSQIQRGAGVSRHKAIDATRLFERLGLIAKRRSGYRGTNEYEPVLTLTGDQVVSIGSALDALVRGAHHSGPATSARSDTPLVHEAHKQKPTIQKDSKRTAGGGGVGEEGEPTRGNGARRQTRQQGIESLQATDEDWKEFRTAWHRAVGADERRNNK